MLTTTCQTCRTELRAQDQYAGRPVRCPQCGTICRLPEIATPGPVVGQPAPLCVVCLAAVSAGPARVVDANGCFYHRHCYEEACCRAEQRSGGSGESLPLGASEHGELEVAVAHEAPATRPLVRPQRRRELWIGLGAVVPAAAVLLILIQTFSGASRMPANSREAVSGGDSPRETLAPGGPEVAPPVRSDSGRDRLQAGAPARGGGLAEARRGFQTKLHNVALPREPVPSPPGRVFHVVFYDSPVGRLAAYLTPNPGDGRRHPAILWITGGDCNSIGDCWSAAPPSNDQSARAFRQAGIVMMFPSLRGGNDNPGSREGFLGEVEDVLAAADCLAGQPYVDPERIYLGGHSTGGTLALLVAETSPRFRAVFSFGPVDDPGRYSREIFPFATSDCCEVELRSPIHWLPWVASPVFVFEGTSQGNLASLQKMARVSRNPQIHFHPVPGTDHFSILHPMTQRIAEKILRDEGATSVIAITEDELRQVAQSARELGGTR